MNELPIARCLPEIVAAVVASTPVVLKAPPGAGKTTGVPPGLLSAGIADHGQILLVQPRRLAARSAAKRLAELAGGRVGDEIGYHVRFDRRTSANTKLVAMTTGVLLRRLQSDPLLEDVACVLLDEFHERSLDVDLALGMLHRIRTTLRPELKLVVMSATLDPQGIADFLSDRAGLGDATAIHSEGRSYPVSIRYANQTCRDRIEHQIAEILPTVLRETAGHLLVFLPGVGEIRRTHSLIRNTIANDIEIMELYGDLSPTQQDAVLRQSRFRKIVLSTNVAETSITIPGVTAVIDSGLARVMRFDSAIGLPKLQLEPISQASAEQRAGRAGRTEPGVCYRLWTAIAHRSRRERDTPEVERADFCSAALALFAWGERDPFDFPWLSPPPPQAVETAVQLLQQLEAIDADRSLTETGRRMLRLPVHPRLARFMLSAEEFGVADLAAVAAALLTERDPFRFPHQQPRSVTHDCRCDVFDKVEQLNDFFAGGDSPAIDPGSAKQIRRVASQLLRGFDLQGVESDLDHGESRDTRLARSLLSAYPNRVAKRRGSDDQGNSRDDRGRMMGGRGVRLDRRSGVRWSDLFLCIDVDSSGTEALVRTACAIEESWLDRRLVRIVDEPFFDQESGGVVARRRRYFDDLLLGETPIKCDPCERVAELLVAAARSQMNQAFPQDDKRVASFVERSGFVCRQMPELDFTPLDDGVLDQVLVLLCQTRTTLDQLRQAPWLDHLKGVYDYEQLQMIDQHAPSTLRVPSGNSISVNYRDGKPPCMEVRIQELFGWQETPRIAAGRVTLQLHLLGPNGRPQQITDDLANFWKSTYQHVRKELRRRYPKHHWPEDPTSAVATRNGLKPKPSS